MYEVFEHTADIGLRVRAPDLNALFAEAGRGLFSLIVENLDEVQPQQELTVRLAGEDRELLLFDWLNELLFQFDAHHLVFSRFQVAVDEGGLTATVAGEPVDPARHRLDHEVKAITYHGLKVAQEPGGWVAEVIVDI
jgi:SHS2 domain-containing protein